MSKLVPLEMVAEYSKKRIKTENVSLKDFITTDNMLQNKAGITVATNLPPKGISMTAYEEGNILIGNIRPYLKKIWFANRSGGCSADVLVFQVKKEYFPKYVYYSIFKNDFFDHMMRGKKGTKMPRGDKNQILDFLIPNFDYTIQKNIVSVLSVLDSKIELNNQINFELESMAKLIYDFWFVQFDFPNSEGKPYKTSGGKMIWNKELKREIPEGWKDGNLLEIAEYTNGLPCQKYRPIGKEHLRVIKIREMHEGFSSEPELVRPDIPEKLIIENGDVLFSWSASLEVQIWSKGKGALNQHIFKVSSEKYPKSFYFYQLINYLEHFKMMAKSRKTTMGHITQDHLQQSRISLPPKELTFKLEDILAPIFMKKLNNEIENQQLSELRDWLIPMLMNGQITI